MGQGTESFWNKVDVKLDDECWNWKGKPNNSGYGRFIENYTHILAHRKSWEINRGPIPSNKHVLHKCNNRICVNPNHLYLGNLSDNAKDRESLMRELGISHNGPTPRTLYEGEYWLLNRLANKGIHYSIICKMFKISKSLFYRIRKEGS